VTTPTSCCSDRLEILSRSLDGDLDAAELRELQAHLAGCAGCSAVLRRLSEAKGAATRHAAGFHPPDHLQPMILAALRREGLVGSHARPGSRFLRLSTMQGLAAAAVIVLSVGGVFWLAYQGYGSKEVLEKGIPAASPPAAVPSAPAEAAPEAQEGATDSLGQAGKPREEILKKSDANAPTSPAVPKGSTRLRDAGAAVESEQAPARREAMPESQRDESVGSRLDSPAEPSAKSQAAPRFAPAPPSVLQEESPRQKDSKEREAVGAEGGAPGAAAPSGEPTFAAAPSAPRAAESKRESAARKGKVAGAIESDDEADSTADDLMPASNWYPEGDTVWDYPPRWTPEALRVISRVRGDRVVLEVGFAGNGKITSARVIDGDRRRGDEILKLVRALDQAVVAARRRGTLIAGVGQVELVRIGG
jgi:hypothetical protein